MNTTNQNNVTAAPSVTIAPRNPARGVLNFVVTLTTHKDVRSYPCRTLESAIKLVERFIAGVTKPARPASEPSTRPDHLSSASKHPSCSSSLPLPTAASRRSPSAVFDIPGFVLRCVGRLGGQC